MFYVEYVVDFSTINCNKFKMFAWSKIAAFSIVRRFTEISTFQHSWPINKF